MYTNFFKKLIDSGFKQDTKKKSCYWRLDATGLLFVVSFFEDGETVFSVADKDANILASVYRSEEYDTLEKMMERAAWIIVRGL
jgi:hypothetical protein